MNFLILAISSYLSFGLGVALAGRKIIMSSISDDPELSDLGQFQADHPRLCLFAYFASISVLGFPLAVFFLIRKLARKTS